MMNEEKNKIEVLIGGKVYTIVGEEGPEYMQRIARYIDLKMEELGQAESIKRLSTSSMAVLTSINVADDYFKLLEELDNAHKQLTAYDENMKQRDTINEENAERIHMLEAQLEEQRVKAEELQEELDTLKKRYCNEEGSIEELRQRSEEALKKEHDKYHTLYEDMERFKDEFGKIQEENYEYEKLLDECQLELIQYKNELNQYKHG